MKTVFKICYALSIITGFTTIAIMATIVNPGPKEHEIVLVALCLATSSSLIFGYLVRSKIPS